MVVSQPDEVCPKELVPSEARRAGEDRGCGSSSILAGRVCEVRLVILIDILVDTETHRRIENRYRETEVVVVRQPSGLRSWVKI